MAGGVRGGGVSPYWWLLLLPIFPLAGWGLGQISAPAPKPPQVSARWYSEPLPASVEPPKQEAAPGEVSGWTTFESAVAESRRTGKPVFVDFSADWCGPCQMLRHQVFENPERGRAVQVAVIPVSIVDRRHEEGRNPPDIDELQRRYNVDAFPTLVVFSPRTGRSERIAGVGPPDLMVAWITGAAKAVR